MFARLHARMPDATSDHQTSDISQKNPKEAVQYCTVQYSSYTYRYYSSVGAIAIQYNKQQYNIYILTTGYVYNFTRR